MRHPATPVAVALVTLVLMAGGCKPSTLTPFWIGSKGPETAGQNINGTWAGTTANGGDVRFFVSNQQVSGVLLFDKANGCNQRFELVGKKLLVVDDEFSAEVKLLPQGRFALSGRFGSPTLCTGSYFFEALAVAGNCPVTASGQFTAQKQ